MPATSASEIWFMLFAEPWILMKRLFLDDQREYHFLIHSKVLYELAVALFKGSPQTNTFFLSNKNNVNGLKSLCITKIRHEQARFVFVISLIIYRFEHLGSSSLNCPSHIPCPCFLIGLFLPWVTEVIYTFWINLCQLHVSKSLLLVYGNLHIVSGTTNW